MTDMPCTSNDLAAQVGDAPEMADASSIAMAERSANERQANLWVTLNRMFVA